MIVPLYWAEASKKAGFEGRTVTLHRFGWSDADAADARALAERRVAEAAARFERGEKPELFERKVPYNGAEGVPIREEVLARHGDVVITRNAYGARCLNTPNALFADVDAKESPRSNAGYVAVLVVGVGVAVAGLVSGHALVGCSVGVFVLLLSRAIVEFGHRALGRLAGGPDARALRRIRAFASANPAWSLRVYATPAGFRVLATHAPMDPASPEVRRFFDAIDADPVYVQMCLRQRCFRARLSAKPWRVGIADHMRPRPGVWPVHPSMLQTRERWIATYEAAAAKAAACRFVESLGPDDIHRRLRDVVELHDRESRALERDLPIA